MTPYVSTFWVDAAYHKSDDFFFEPQQPATLSSCVSACTQRAVSPAANLLYRGKLPFRVIESENNWEKFNGG